MKTLAPIDSEGRKRCLACQQVKLAEEFRFDPKQAHYDSGGRRTKCKTCEAELARRKYHGSIESRVKTIIAAAKWRARRNGIPFTLQPSDVVIPSRCPVLGVPLAYNAAGFGTHRDPYTLHSTGMTLKKDTCQGMLSWCPGWRIV